MSQNSFYRDKFFYIILLLLIGSFGWTTFTGWGLTQAISDHCKDADRKTEDIRKDYTLRDEIILKEIQAEFKEINKALTTLQVDIKYIKHNRIDTP